MKMPKKDDIKEVIEHYLKYIKEEIKEEYRGEFVKDDEPFIKFSHKEFEGFSTYIMRKALQKYKAEKEQEINELKELDDSYVRELHLQIVNLKQQHKAKMQTLILEIDKIIDNWQSELIGDIRDLKKQIKQKIKEMM